MECAQVCMGVDVVSVYNQAIRTVKEACAKHGYVSRVVTLAADQMSFVAAKEGHVQIQRVEATEGEWCTVARTMLLGSYATRYLRLFENEKPVSTHIRRRPANSVHTTVLLRFVQ